MNDWSNKFESISLYSFFFVYFLLTHVQTTPTPLKTKIIKWKTAISKPTYELKNKKKNNKLSKCLFFFLFSYFKTFFTATVLFFFYLLFSIDNNIQKKLLFDNTSVFLFFRFSNLFFFLYSVAKIMIASF